MTAIVDQRDYSKIIHELEDTGDISLDTKFELAVKVFEHTAL